MEETFNLHMLLSMKMDSSAPGVDCQLLMNISPKDDSTNTYMPHYLSTKRYNSHEETAMVPGAWPKLTQHPTLNGTGG